MKYIRLRSPYHLFTKEDNKQHDATDVKHTKHCASMPKITDILKEVKTHTSKLFNTQLPEHLHYHNFTHTSYVVESAQNIGEAEGLQETELYVLGIAAWWHDIGYLHVSEGHEALSQELAIEYLRKKKTSEKIIRKVTGCIAATKMPQSPQNHIEEVICDADLAHLAAKDFMKRCSFLRLEWEAMRGETMSELEWLEINNNFMNKHSYFTDYGKKVLNIQKKKNIQKINRLIKAEKEKISLNSK